MSLTLAMIAVWESCYSFSSAHSASFSSLAASISAIFSLSKSLKSSRSAFSSSFLAFIGLRDVKRSFNS